MSGVEPVMRSRVMGWFPFYYGWVIVAVGTLGLLMMGPSQTFTVSLFIDFFVEDLKLTRATVSLLYGAATLGASLLLPLSGRLVDRLGPRVILVLVSLGLALACLAISLARNGAALVLGFILLRYFGFGSLQIVSSTLIAQWFIRRRGFVMGLASQSLAVGLILFPLFAEWLIAGWGWRWAWIWLGCTVAAILAPIGWLLTRNAPEPYGLPPDGVAFQPSRAQAQRTASERQFTLSQAQRTAAFWVYLLAFSVISMSLAGLVFHQISLFEERGFQRLAAVRAFQYLAFFTVLGSVGMGRLLDAVTPRWLMAGSLGLLSLSIVSVMSMSSSLHVLLFAALTGLVGGHNRVLDATVWAQFYGRQHLGAIRGYTMIGTLGGTALGAYPLGFSLDRFGSYRPALMALAIIPLLVGLAVLIVKLPNQRA